ncbi:MAG: flagellar filament capping protein FliD [Proteobacteria bacterium]|nr:flagellar filament capping protein FliD [Pseudomonadota bacterium]
MSNTSPVSIASGSSAGAAGGSVIDVASLVSQLVAATQAPQEALIQHQTQAVTSEISAVGQLKSSLSTFQSSLGSLDSATAFASLGATSSDNTAFTAVAGSGATLGSYSVSVSQLAQAQQLVSSTAYSSSSATAGTGTLQLSLGSGNFSVTIGSSNNTLSGIAAAINSASGNPGIQASVVTGTSGAHLVLTSSMTGASNTITVSETDGGNGLSALTYASGGANYTQQSAAQDASFAIAGVSYTSPSNTVTGALSGVTLSLLAPTSSPATLSVADNTSTIEGNIKAFVSAYNTLQSSFSSLGSYDATTNTAGPLLGNPVLSGAQSQISAALHSVVKTGSSTYNTLASIGITSKSDGTLSVNAATLSAALSSNFTAVSNLFSGAGGVATSLNTALTNELASGGPIDSLSQTLVKQNNALTQQSQKLSQQMSSLQASLTQQYSSLNALLSQLQSTSSYLTQAFATLPNAPSSSG